MKTAELISEAFAQNSRYILRGPVPPVRRMSTGWCSFCIPMGQQSRTNSCPTSGMLLPLLFQNHTENWIFRSTWYVIFICSWRGTRDVTLLLFMHLCVCICIHVCTKLIILISKMNVGFSWFLIYLIALLIVPYELPMWVLKAHLANKREQTKDNYL